jgi:ribosomal protein S3
MGQKVNPISLRLEQTNRHFDSCWFNDYNYTHLLNRDINIQSYINLVLKQIKYSSARFFIQNLPNKIKINVFFLNPKGFRKSAAGAFQLKDSFKVHNLAATKRKSKKIKRITRIAQLVKKNTFLKHYKMDKNSKTKALSYLLLKAYNTNKKNCTENEIKFFLRYLLLKNFSLKFKEKPLCPLLSPPSLMGGNDPLLFRKVKKNANNQPASPRSRATIQCFLFSNLRNLRLLNNKNKLILTTNFLKTKIHDYKHHLQENIIQNKIKFSSLIPAATSGTMAAKKSHYLAVSPANVLTLKQQDYTTLTNPNLTSHSRGALNKGGDCKSRWPIQNDNADGSFLALSSTPSMEYFNSPTKKQQNHSTPLVAVKHFNKTKCNVLSSLLNSTAKQQNINSNYLFLSLINNESLKKTHKHYNKVFKDFSHFSSSHLALPCPVGQRPVFTKEQILDFSETNEVYTALEGKGFTESKKLPCFAATQGAKGKVDHFQYRNMEISRSEIIKNGTLEKSYKTSKKKVLLLRNSSYKTHLESQLSNVFSSDVVLSFFRLFNEKQSAVFLAEEIVYYLEKRVPFFKIKNQILREIHKSSFLKGLRITCSGRVGGRSKKAQRAKIQIIKYGQTSLHVFSSKIDFASKHAHTTFGLLGIKVWICYN